MSNIWAEIEKFITVLSMSTDELSKIPAILKSVQRLEHAIAGGLTVNPTDEWKQEFTKEIVMALTDAVSAEFAKVSDLIAKVGADVSALLAEVADLKAKVASGLQPEEVIAGLTELEGKLGAIDAAVNPPAPPAQ
jgi:hypothetical protein